MEELFDIVDENNNIIGFSTRKEAHKKGLIHKSAMFFIFNKKGEIFLNKRSSKKEFDPGTYSIVLGGHVTKGDSYKQTVIREAKEEAGITEKPHFLANFKSRYREKDKENVALYYFVVGKEPILDKNEIEYGNFIPIDKIKDILKKEKFIPETEIIYKILMKNQEKIFKSLTKIP